MLEHELRNHLAGVAIIGLAGRLPAARATDECRQNPEVDLKSILSLRVHASEMVVADGPAAHDRAQDQSLAEPSVGEVVAALLRSVADGDAHELSPQRLRLLQCAGEALENAGYDVETFTRPLRLFTSGTRSGQPFAGAPALYFACRSILRGESQMALAGVVNSQAQQPGETAGVLLLKGLEQALADGDFVHGVIEGAAVNDDGALEAELPLVVEEAPEREPSAPGRDWQLFLLSAATPTALDTLSGHVADAL
ncbi:MAG: hypothetical protein QOH49_4641, partial [Acidobacteriota bacterium]|nr:hypothetical protein [Acidobacteriota bacterium]